MALWNFVDLDLPTESAASAATATAVAAVDWPGNPLSNKTSDVWFRHSAGQRINTDVVIAQSLARQYAGLKLTIAPPTNGLSLLRYAEAGHAVCKPLPQAPGEDSNSGNSTGVFSPLAWTVYEPPRSRLDGDPGALGQELHFGHFEYSWRGHDFILYVVDGRDGPEAYSARVNHYILAEDNAAVDALLLAAGAWANELHGEVWVFDQGYWQKSAELFRSVMGASWDSVILDPKMKRAIIDDHISFFESRDTYARLKVPWKRGVIYHGPPGNGKTISIKATMHMLYAMKHPIPTLYVRSLSSFNGPEYALMSIFSKARQFAPCYLVFEDLDSIVSDNVRSYFLNEVDGLKNNDGIFMIGSTNHLERLDPGISKRPSRFDRKYFFPDPDLEQRIAYCKFWQKKLADNKDVEFPDELCKAIAEITDKFSFAYMQEAFVAALLAIARRSQGLERRSEESLTRDVGDDGWLDVCHGGGDDDLDDLVLWVEIKKQIETLREGMEAEKKMVVRGKNKSRKEF
ncbi:P-loop containing nucleoside triphosphate hydrolase protein [Nemania sp. FL0031]|nr:P-loop containing nucleoside triphosphate hydrolase protein [Nemania sp. FL0031]